MAERKHTLLTGATGHIGQYLLKDLMLAEHPLVIVTRSKDGVSPENRIARMIEEWNLIAGIELPMPVCLEGDTSQEGFGLSMRDRHWVQDHCNTLFHNAASVAFNTRGTGTTWDNNYSSALQTLEVCREAKIEHLIFVSTAYVSGNRKGTVYEGELDCGQKFRNEYEHSKLEAERAIRQSSIPDCTTVLRPGIVVGDYASGHTSSYHSFYRFAQFTWILANAAAKDSNGRWQHNVRLSMSGNERRHMIPVDWISRAMVSILNNRECWGKTFHLTPSKPATSLDIEQSLQNYFRYDGVSFVGRAGFHAEEGTGEEKKFYEFLEDYHDYFEDEPVFDRTNTDLANFDFPEPQVDVECLLRMINFAVHCRFGKHQKRARAKAHE